MSENIFTSRDPDGYLIPKPGSAIVPTLAEARRIASAVDSGQEMILWSDKIKVRIDKDSDLSLIARDVMWAMGGLIEAEVGPMAISDPALIRACSGHQ